MHIEKAYDHVKWDSLMTIRWVLAKDGSDRSSNIFLQQDSQC